ncbi:MAG: proton-conducting transporter membrane subunit [Chloroflexota bacterium]
MIAGLLLFLALPLALAGVVYALRRWGTLSSLLSIGATLALGIIIVVLPLGRTVELWDRQIVMGGTLSFLGRELVLEDVDRLAIAVLYLTAAGIFALAWPASPRSMLFPVGLGLLSLLSGSLLIRPLIYAVLLAQVAIALSIFALQPEERGPTRGGLQYLSFSLLALPGLLLSHWLMGRYALTPDDVALLDASAVLLALSFALLLGSVPFHMWVPSAVSESEPLAGAFILTVNNGAIWFLLLTFLETYPDLSAYPGFPSLASIAGLGMVVVGGLLAASQRRLGRLVGYGALVDSGIALVALGMASERGLSLVMLGLLVRPFGVVLMATGLKGLRSLSGGDDSLETLRGLAWDAPWCTLAFLIGALSLAGVPVTAGFAGRWALYRALAPTDLGAVLLMMLATLGVMIGVWRALSVLLAHPEPADDAAGPAQREGAAPAWLMAGLVVSAAAASIAVGLFPQLLSPTALRLASLYTFLGP